MRLRRDTALMEEEEIVLVANVSDALAHPLRIKLYQYVMECNKDMRDVCTGDLVEAFGYSQATISQHMNKLIASGLVDMKKKDRFSLYFANIGLLMKYLSATKKFSSFTR